MENNYIYILNAVKNINFDNLLILDFETILVDINTATLGTTDFDYTYLGTRIIVRNAVLKNSIIECKRT